MNINRREALAAIAALPVVASGSIAPEIASSQCCADLPHAIDVAKVADSPNLFNVWLVWNPTTQDWIALGDATPIMSDGSNIAGYIRADAAEIQPFTTDIWGLEI